MEASWLKPRDRGHGESPGLAFRSAGSDGRRGESGGEERGEGVARHFLHV